MTPDGRGWLRHGARLLTPSALVAAQLALERDAEQRARRLGAAPRDRARELFAPRRATMRALRAMPRGRLSWQSVPVPPPPRPHGAIVRPVAVATCDLDRPLALGTTPFPLPLHLGHECVAEVVSVGSAVTAVSVGQRVVVPFQVNCGACVACRAGFTANCMTVPPLSMYGFGIGGGHWGGAVADELAVPFADAMLVPLPPGIDPAAAASVADNVSDAYRHVAPHLPRLLAGDADIEVLIVAATSRRHQFSSSVPLYTGLVARALGVRHVTLVDSRPGVRAKASELGFEAIDVRQLSRRPSARLVADISVNPRGLRLALSKTAPDGVCSCAGSLHATARVPAARMYGRNVTLHVGRTHARAVIPEVLELMVAGKLQPERVTTAIAPLDDAPAALAEHFAGHGTKTILTAT